MKIGWRVKLFVLSSWMMVGCVSQGRYLKLQGEFDAQAQKLEMSEEQVRMLQGEGDDKDAQLEKMRAAHLELETAKAEVSASYSEALKDRSQLKASVDQMQQALDAAERKRKEAEGRVKDFRALLQRFQALIDTGRLEILIRGGKMIVAMSTDVLFDSGHAELSEDGKVAVREVTAVLLTLYKRQFQVVGHTDNVPMRSKIFPSNWHLASARALNVLQTMLEAKMPPERISAASYGESDPVASNDSAEGRAKNRRIEIIVVPDLSSLPGFDELLKLQNAT